MIGLLLAAALAQEPATAPRTWGGLVLPLVSANSTDGLGFGAGGEVFRRPRDPEDGQTYDLKITLSTYFTVSGRYQSHFLQVEARRDTHTLVQVGLAKWTNLLYAGQGGAEVLQMRPAREGGSEMLAPFGMVAVTVPVGAWSVYGQAFTRFARIDPGPGTLLDEQRPFGATGGWFGDVAGGVYREEVDRWPLPTAGWLAEGAVRIGLGVDRDGIVKPVGGPHLEAAGWWSPHERLTIGGRGIASQTFGVQPMFVQELLPGRWRDEVGFEQPLTGYGRTRPRGDGLIAGLVGVRTHLLRARKGFFDLGVSLSTFAELGWLFDRQDPGPPMPTLGVGVPLLWQEATVLRPFFAWGWRGDDPGSPRYPVMQFGIALKDPL